MENENKANQMEDKEMKFNQYSIEAIKEMVEKGQRFSKEYANIDAMIYGEDISFSEMPFITMGFENPEWTVPEQKTYYRIGEPVSDGYGYKNSYNFSEDRPENGISVVTTEWLHSMKSVFFNTTDEKIAQRGVWKIEGIEIPSAGGDDETLIIPMGWAEKTRIRTRSGLEKAVKNN